MRIFRIICKVLRILKGILKGLWQSGKKLSTIEFWLELAWLGAKCKGKTLLVIEIFFTLHRYCTATVWYVLVLSIQSKTWSSFLSALLNCLKNSNFFKLAVLQSDLSLSRELWLLIILLLSYVLIFTIGFFRALEIFWHLVETIPMWSNLKTRLHLKMTQNFDMPQILSAKFATNGDQNSPFVWQATPR